MSAGEAEELCAGCLPLPSLPMLHQTPLSSYFIYPRFVLSVSLYLLHYILLVSLSIDYEFLKGRNWLSFPYLHCVGLKFSVGVC